MQQVILAKDFNIANVGIGSVRTLDNGGKIVYLNYKSNKLFLQTPKLKAPFGLSNWEGKYSLDLSLSGYDGSVESVKTFYTALATLDEYMLDQGMQNGMAWFKRKMASTEVVDALYSRNVKFAKDKATGEVTDKYPPTFKLSLPFRDGKFACDVYDVKRNPLDLSSVELKGAKITAIAQCTGVWLAGGKFGCSWKVVQLLVEPQETIKGYAFKDIEDSANAGESDIEDEFQEASDAGAGANGGTSAVADACKGIKIDTSDDEDNGDELVVADDDELESVNHAGASSQGVDDASILAASDKKASASSGRGRKASVAK